MRPEAGCSGRGRKLLHVNGGQTKPSGVSHSPTGAVKKKDTAGVSLDGGVEKLTQGGENHGQRTSLPNQSADPCTDFGDARPHPRCCSVLCRGAISGFAMTWRQ